MLMQAESAIDEIIRITNTGRPRRVIAELARQIEQYPVTPLVRLSVELAGKPRMIALKLEGLSPWGSIKGRTAIGLIASVAPSLRDQCTLVESTSGNLGVAMAGISQQLGLSFSAIVDSRLPRPMRERIFASGAGIIVAEEDPCTEDPLAQRMATAARITGEDPNKLWPNQYQNLANPLIHELWTGPELFEQLPDVEAVFIGASTGGTLSGVSRAARRIAPRVRIVGVDVQGSTVFGGCAGLRVLTGIGASRRSNHVTEETVDAVEIISSMTGIDQCREMFDATGLSLGGSSGAVLAAALRHLRTNTDLTSVACICPDMGDSYVDTIFNDSWVDGQRALLREQAIEGDVPALEFIGAVPNLSV